MSEESAAAPDAAGADPAAGAAGECENCLRGRTVVAALAFAAFAAYVAADFATGGKLSAAVLGALAALRGRAAPDA